MRKTIISHAAWLRARPFVIVLTGLLFLCSLYLIDTYWPTRLSQREYDFAQSSNWSSLAQSPLDWPVRLLQTGFMAIGGQNAAYLRAPAALAAIISVVLLYTLVRRWHNRRIAVMAALLFAASGWMLHTARSGLPFTWYGLVPLVLLAFGSWLNTTKRSKLAVLLSAGLFAGLLYIPGAIWFELFAGLLLLPILRKHCQAAGSATLAMAAGLKLIILGWLVYSFVRFPDTIGRWLGLQADLPSLVVFAKQWLLSAGFMVRGPLAPDMWLGRAPLLDMFSLVTLALGVYIYIRHNANLRARLIAGFTVIGSLLVAFNGFTSLSYMLPMVYLLVAAGIAFLLHEWYVIFPRNPVARTIGTIAVVVAVLCACTYHLSAYFIAWQRSPETAQGYTRSLP